MARLPPSSIEEVSLIPSTDTAPCEMSVEMRLLEAGEKPAQDNAHILGEVAYAGLTGLRSLPHMQLTQGLTLLDQTYQGEVWVAAEPVNPGVFSDIQFARNEHILFGAVSRLIPESRAEFEKLVFDIYHDIFRLTETSGMPRLVRVWNSFPLINQVIDGLERYQQFTAARFQAFEQHYGEFTSLLPAATAVGSDDDRLSIYFLATDQEPLHRENTRQTRAYEYPAQYGPKSPSFSRATLQTWPHGRAFYISGTASIVGHESRHLGDVVSQCNEALNNVRSLIEDLNEEFGYRLDGLAALDTMKVYIRNPADFPSVQAVLHERCGESLPVIYLRADICREELLVEVEGLIQSPEPFTV